MIKISFTKTFLSDVVGPESEPIEGELADVLFRQIGGWFNVLPPRSVLNEVLELGGHTHNNIFFKWQPFTLNEKEYADLQNEVINHKEWGIEVDFPTSNVDNMNEWSHWALVRALNKKRR